MGAPPPSRSTAAVILGKAAPAVSLLVAVVFFQVIAPDQPLDSGQVRTILVQTVIVALAALGMTLVIVSGGIDLSVGSAVALSSVVAARVTETLWSGAAGAAQPYFAIVAGILTGAVCGLYSGALIVLLRLPPFIVTLGMMGFYRGLAKWAAESQQVRGHAGWIGDWVLALPPAGLAWSLVAPSVWVMLVVAVGMAAMMHWTVLGRRAVAIGSNEEAARRAAVPIGKVKVLVYSVSGALVGLAGVVKFARLSGSGDPTSAMGLELDAVAAVVIGGGSLAGGSASVVGTLCGALLMALLDNRCTALGWPNYVQQLVVGHIIVLAVALDRWRHGRTAA